MSDLTGAANKGLEILALEKEIQRLFIEYSPEDSKAEQIKKSIFDLKDRIQDMRKEMLDLMKG